MRPGLDPGRGVCGISVAADLAGMGVQTLRLDEARGLLHPTAQTAEPAATAPTNLDRLRHIGDLLDAGLNRPATYTQRCSSPYWTNAHRSSPALTRMCAPWT